MSIKQYSNTVTVRRLKDGVRFVRGWRKSIIEGRSAEVYRMRHITTKTGIVHSPMFMCSKELLAWLKRKTYDNA